MGEKVKTHKNSRDQKLTQKNSHAKFPSLEISRKNYMITHVVLNLAVLYSQNYAAGMRGHYRESSDCFEEPPKISLLKSSHPKNTWQNFNSYRKKSRNRKFQILKNPLSILEYPLPPTPWIEFSLFVLVFVAINIRQFFLLWLCPSIGIYPLD